MMRRLWMLAIVLGIALGAAALVVPHEALDEVFVRLRLDTLSPLAHPPIGQTARFALAGAALFAGLLVAAALWRLTRPRADQEPDANADVDVAVAPAPSMVAPAPTLVPPTASFPDVSPAVTFAPPVSQARPAEPGQFISMSSDSDAVSISDPAPITAVAVDDPQFARIETMLVRMESHETERFGAIEARLAQMAQQLVELGGLARAAARTPASASAPALATVAMHVRAPADSKRRHAVGSAARALRKRLDEEFGAV